MECIEVKIPGHEYPIHFGNRMLASLGECCLRTGITGKVAVVTNERVGGLYFEPVAASLRNAGFSVSRCDIPDGEQYKNSGTLNMLYDRFVEIGLDRKSSVIALGGGVVGDLAGFAAATYMRGIAYIQVPTTLLAQVDSSVGGKTGIDHPGGKNLIGAFYQPRMVFADSDVLTTLDDRNYRAGMAEVVKYGIVLDADFFGWLEEHAGRLSSRDPSLLPFMTRRCCELKARIVAQDEKESDIRAVLNYGHTLGHAFEAAGGFTELVHGEAVSMGMIAASGVSFVLGHCDESDVRRIRSLLESLGLPVDPPAEDMDKIRMIVGADKKSASGTVSFVCNRGIGQFELHPLTPAEIMKLSGLEA